MNERQSETTAGTAGGGTGEISGSDLRENCWKLWVHHFAPTGCALTDPEVKWDELQPGFRASQNEKTLCVFQRVDVGAELQRRPQFKVHGADQVILGEEQQSLAVDFLRAKLFSYVLTTCREEETDGHATVYQCWK